MVTPTFNQARALVSQGGGVATETLMERILTMLAVQASGQNPDLTTWPGPVPSGTYVQSGSPNKNTLATAGTLLFGTNVTGDTNDRFTIGADGKLSWGPGNGPTDGTFARIGVGVFQIGAPTTAVTLGVIPGLGQSGISFQNGEAGSAISRLGPGELGTSGIFDIATTLRAQYATATQVVIGNAGPGGASGISFQAGEAGSNLYRNAAGSLTCDGALVAASLLRSGGTVQVGNGLVGLATGSAAGAGNPASLATLSFGTGAPVNASGANGDVYLRTDGGAGTTIYQRRAGAWVGIV